MKSTQKTAAENLRRRAEEKLKRQTSVETTPPSADETQRLLHELQVHQIELEMQNEELIQARDNLETLLDKYTGLYDFAPVGYFALDRNGNISSANLAGAKLLEVERSQFSGRRFGDFVVSADRSVFADFLDRVCTSESKETCEVTLVNEKNSPLFVQIEAVGNISEQECLLAVIDITSSKISALATAKTASILQMIATGQPAEQIYNSIALMYEGRHPGLRCSMLSLKRNKLLHGGAPSLPEEYCAAVNGLEYGPNVGSCGTSTYTGQRVLVEDIATDPKWVTLKNLALAHGLRSCWSEPIKDSAGKVLGAFGMYHNDPALPNEDELTDLVSAAQLTGIVMEREQRESLLVKLSNSLKQSGEAIFITDAEGCIEYVNPAFLMMTGYSEAEAVGHHPCYLGSGEPNVELYDDIWETVTSGKVWADKIIDKRKDGSFYPAHLTVSPVKNNHGESINFIGVQGDLSERQRLEEQLQQAQKMEAMGTLVGGIAHDFNNTLAGITGNLYLAKKGAAEHPKVVEKLLKAETLAFRAAETIQQLLSFTRKGIVQQQPIPLAPFLREAIKLQQVTIPENISLQIEVQDISLVVNGDVNQLQQVLMNLLNNARDAVADVKNPFISIVLKRFYADGEYLKKHPYVKSVDFACISVSDNGCGIREHNRQHIFEPFFTTKGVGRGTGLGLSMVYGAVKSHGGHIEVSSAETGQGATFELYFPLLEMIDAILPSEVGDEIILGHRETILLVDDNEIVLEIGKSLLEELNYKVLTAKDGQEAVDIYRAFKDVVDLLVIDVVMPKMGGVEALRIIRQEEPQVKAIFCTGYDKLNAVVKDVGIDLESVITKPFSISKLSQKLRRTLG